MECDALDLHRNFIKIQKQQIELANNLIENANGNEEVIRMANELIKSCEKSISIEQNMTNFVKEEKKRKEILNDIQEHRIGQIITTPDNTKIKVVKYGNSNINKCMNCDWYDKLRCPKCLSHRREDKTDIIYKSIIE